LFKSFFFALLILILEKNRLNLPQTARLFSAILREIQTNSCVVFWYSAYSNSIVDTSRLNVLIHNLADLSYRQVWSDKVSNDKSIVWRKGFFSYTSLNRHQIVFEATRASDSTTSIAIDDISVYKFSDCYNRITPPQSTTQFQTQTQTQTIPTSTEATFQTNTFTQISNQATTDSNLAGNFI
jgi:hypothetical protein